MATANPSLPPVPGTDWQLLGEIDLPAGAAADSEIRTWISETLDPLHLSPDFLTRVVKSAQESAVRSQHPYTDSKLMHVHLSVHAPREQISKGKTWGFFHIERIDDRAEVVVHHHHAIDYYLYMEGE